MFTIIRQFAVRKNHVHVSRFMVKVTLQSQIWEIFLEQLHWALSGYNFAFSLINFWLTLIVLKNNISLITILYQAITFIFMPVSKKKSSYFNGKIVIVLVQNI